MTEQRINRDHSSVLPRADWQAAWHPKFSARIVVAALDGRRWAAWQLIPAAWLAAGGHPQLLNTGQCLYRASSISQGPSLLYVRVVCPAPESLHLAQDSEALKILADPGSAGRSLDRQ